MNLPSRHDCQLCPTRNEGVFCHLPEEQITELNRCKTTNYYKRGQVLFYEGNAPKGLFCVNSGKVKLFKSGDDGHDVIVRLVGPGDILGYRSILSDEVYAATAEVIEEAEICFVERNFFIQLLAKNGDVALQVFRKLGKDLGSAQTHISDLLNKNVRQRLSHLLLVLTRSHGKKVESGSIIDIRLTRAELAQMVGTTTETVIRTLSDLDAARVIELDGKKIVILKPEELLNESAID